MAASWNKHVEVMDKLLQNGAKVNLQTRQVMTMLIHEYISVCSYTGVWFSYNRIMTQR